MVSAERGSPAARRYLLGTAGDEECDALEREYFGDEAAVDRIAAIEEDLVEQYLADQLDADERRLFERHYLASPDHRARVDTIRRLSAMGGSGRRQPRPALVDLTESSSRWSYRWLAIAATLVMAVGILSVVIPRRSQAPTVSENRPTSPPQASVPPPSRVFALSLSPVSVRSAADSPSLVIPAGTDVVALQLEGDPNGAKMVNARAVIRTVAGDEVWRGSTTPAADLPAGVVARVDVPAARLNVDDYLVVLSSMDPAGLEQERDRYFLRVRSR
jgi:hypothetical protein